MGSGTTRFATRGETESAPASAIASVSAIIPTFNRLGSLCSAIDSVLAQQYPLHELIVVDDGSTDGTALHLTRHYPMVKLIRQSNHGVSYARNRAIEQAQGEWLAFLDSDDRWFPDKIGTQIQALADAPANRLCHCDEHWIRNGERVNPKRKHQKRGGHIFEHCLPLCVISPSATMIHKSLFDDIGLFDESLPACEDYDLWLRICAQESVLYVDQPLLEKTGGHDDQLSQRYPAMDRFRLQALAKLIRTQELSADRHALTLTTFTQKLKIFCNGARKRGRVDAIDTLRHDFVDLIDDGLIL